MVNRFSLKQNQFCGQLEFDAGGYWVPYPEHLSEVERLEAENKRLRGELEAANNYRKLWSQHEA